MKKLFLVVLGMSLYCVGWASPNVLNSVCGEGAWHVVGFAPNTNLNNKDRNGEKCDRLANIVNLAAGEKNHVCLKESKKQYWEKAAKLLVANAKKGICLNQDGISWTTAASEKHLVATTSSPHCPAGLWHVVGAIENQNQERTNISGKTCEILLNVQNLAAGSSTPCLSKLGGKALTREIFISLKASSDTGLCITPSGAIFPAKKATPRPPLPSGPEASPFSSQGGYS